MTDAEGSSDDSDDGSVDGVADSEDDDYEPRDRNRILRRSARFNNRIIS